jgi:hypothetical protein
MYGTLKTGPMFAALGNQDSKSEATETFITCLALLDTSRFGSMILLLVCDKTTNGSA